MTDVADRRWWRPSSLWWLGYLLFLIPGPAFDPAAGLPEWGVTVAAVVVFVPFYLLADRSPGSWGHWAPALTALLGALVTPVNAGATMFFIYAAAFAGAALPRRIATRWLFGLTLLVLAFAVVSSVPFPFRILTFLPSLVFVWVVGMVTMDDADRDRSTAALRVENARIEHLSTLAERERISRDLHDLLGQTLTGIVVRSQLAQRLTRTDPDAGIAEMAQVEATARAALTEVRATVTGWRQVVLDDEVRSARDALAAAGVELVVERDDALVLTPSAENALGLALREAVTNVVRHAHAGRCTVALRRVDGRVVLEVADDGVGGAAPDGNGLSGMRERIAALGGSVQRGSVQRLARGGTAVVVAVPAAVAT